MFLKFIYIVFTGILLAAFVGVGISAFYPGPKAPEPLVPLGQPAFNSDQVNYQKQFQNFQKLEQSYNKNVSVTSLVAAIVILVISLNLLKKVEIISDGTLFGGVLTLGYSLFKGFGAEDNGFRFIVVSISLLITFTLGYLKFIKNTKIA